MAAVLRAYALMPATARRALVRPRLRQAALAVLWTVLGSAPLPAAQAAPTHSVLPDQDAVAELLRSAQLWQALEHPDAERQVLRKLLAVQPDQPRALFLLGELELRAGHIEQGRKAAAQLARSPYAGNFTRELDYLLRIYTVERSRLAQLRLLVRGGNQARALRLARALFPDGRPPGDLANEFALVLASTPGGWQTMRELLQARIDADPSPRDRLTLYELLALHSDTREEALRGFADLALGRDVDPQRIASAWRHALLALGNDEQALAQRRVYLARYPTDIQMREEVARVEAEQLTEQRLETDPGVQLRLSAERSLKAGALEQAESELQRSLQLRPDDAETIGLLGLVRLRQGRSQEAVALFEQAGEREKEQPQLRARWLDLTKTAHYWSAIAQARALRDAGDLDGAVRLLEQVRDTQPDQVEAIHLLAALRVDQKREAEAERLYRELLRRDSADARAWRGLLLLRLQQGRVEEALDQARQLPRAANLDPAQVLDATTLRDAVSLASAEHPDVQLRLLERSVELLPRDPWLRYDLARLYLRLQLPGLGQEVMEQGQALAPENVEMHYAAALVAAASGRDDVALATVQSIADGQQTPGMRALAQRLHFEGALRRARNARAASDTQQDAFWRNEALAQAGDDAARLLRVARADLSADDISGARALIDRLAIAQGSLAPEERRSLAGLMIDAGRTDLAQALIAHMTSEGPHDPQSQAQLTLLRARLHRSEHNTAALHEDFKALHDVLIPEDIELHIQALGLMDADRSTAHEWMAELLRSHPQDPQVLLEAARQAERDRQYASAVGYLGVVAVAPVQATAELPIPLLGQVAAPAPNGASAPPAQGLLEDSVQAKAQRELAAIEARRQPQVDTAWLQYSRSATDGLSTLRGTEIPLLVLWPGGYEGHWFGQLDAVRARAGTLPASFAYSSQFGKVQALAPNGLAEPDAQQAQGISAEFGWRGDERRLDLGVVGAGFRVPNLVGAWRESATWHDSDVSAELSRRVLTASLLSYAGAADPVTGALWGGVTDTALTLRVGRDLPRGWNFSSSLSVGVVTGRNVLLNPNAEWRSVVDRDWIHRSDFRFSAGAALSVWHYQYDQDFYTFGHGGYYSPQRYVSVGVPLEVQGRRGALSYDLRAVPAWSLTYVQTAPYYPTDAALQAQAGNPVYTSGTGSGGGPSGSIRADIEYRSTAHWSVGAWLNIDRSAYYAPNQLMVYLRYWLEPQSGAPAFPPHPVLPISQF